MIRRGILVLPTEVSQVECGRFVLRTDIYLTNVTYLNLHVRIYIRRLGNRPSPRISYRSSSHADSVLLLSKTVASSSPPWLSSSSPIASPFHSQDRCRLLDGRLPFCPWSLHATESGTGFFSRLQSHLSTTSVFFHPPVLRRACRIAEGGRTHHQKKPMTYDVDGEWGNRGVRGLIGNPGTPGKPWSQIGAVDQSIQS